MTFSRLGYLSRISGACLLDREELLPRRFSPILLNLWVVEHCNARCVMCDCWQRRPSPTISVEIIDRVLREAEGLGIDSVRITGGEPLLRRDFAEILAALNRRSFRKAVLVTNGLLLDRHLDAINDSALTQVSVSLDGIGETHDRIRGVPGAYRRVVGSLSRLQKNVKVNSILTSRLAGELEEMIAFCEANGYTFGYGVPLRHGPPFFLSSRAAEAVDGMMPNEVELVEMFRILERHQVASRSVLRAARAFMQTGKLNFDHCINPYLMVMVYWNGEVRAGCFGMKAAGNLRRSTLTEILSSEAWARDALIAYRMDCPRECVACTLSAAAASPLSSLPYVLRRFH